MAQEQDPASQHFRVVWEFHLQAAEYVLEVPAAAFHPPAYTLEAALAVRHSTCQAALEVSLAIFQGYLEEALAVFPVCQVAQAVHQEQEEVQEAQDSAWELLDIQAALPDISPLKANNFMANKTMVLASGPLPAMAHTVTAT